MYVEYIFGRNGSDEKKHFNQSSRGMAVPSAR